MTIRDGIVEKVRLFLNGKLVERTLARVRELDCSVKELAINDEILADFKHQSKIRISSINWFVPYFRKPYGGIRTLLRFADFFQTKLGILNRIIVYDPPQAVESEIRSEVTRCFAGLQNAEVIMLRTTDVNTLPECDIAIATFWTSAFLVLKFQKTRGKFYFIQDYEPLFYPAGSLYGLAEATYRFGFYAIVNTPGLWNLLRPNYAGPGTSFTPAIDREVFHPPLAPRPCDKFRLFFYGRPFAPRNAFEVGMTAMKQLKEKWGDKLEVFMAGSPPTPVTRRYEGIVRNLGLLPYERTGDLYRQCHAGLGLMFTKHPSYIPLELMGCGVAVVSNRNESTSWLLKDGKNCLLAEPIPACIAEKVSLLIEDPSLVHRLSSEGLHSISNYSWEEEIQKVFKFMSRQD